MANRNAVIVEDGDTLTCVPGQILADLKDNMIFRNLTDSDVVLVFPDENLFGGINHLEISAHEKSKPLPLSNGNSIQEGCYPYTVYQKSKRKFGHASVPTIIIYRD